MTAALKADEAGTPARPVVKAFAIGLRPLAPTVPVEPIRSNALQLDPPFLRDLWGAIPPPTPFESLVHAYENSALLRPCIDAYVVNIDGLGHQPKPTLHLDSATINQVIEDALYMERVRANAQPGAAPMSLEITPEEVEARKRQLERDMRVELLAFNAFFESCTIGQPFVGLRRSSRRDEEIIGNAFWEVIRNQDTRDNPLGQPDFFNRLPAFSMRLGQVIEQATSIRVRRQITPLTFEWVEVERYFRRFIQLTDLGVSYFKEFGDPRRMSARTGKIHTEMEPLPPDERLATEVLHFRLDAPRGSYGLPRWYGARNEVQGSQFAGESNINWFKNGTMSPGVISVSGDATIDVEELKEQLKELRGLEGQFRFIVLNPTVGAGADASKVEIKVTPLVEQQTDALWQNYDQRNSDKIDRQFRLPKVLTGAGDAKLSDGTTAIVDQQVFNPEREDFDYQMNQILAERGIRYWKFCTNAPTLRDPDRLGQLLIAMLKAGGVNAEEFRELIAPVINQELPVISAKWTRQPYPFTLALLQNIGNLISAGYKLQDLLDIVDAALPSGKEPGPPEPAAPTQPAAGQPAAPAAATPPAAPQAAPANPPPPAG